jgi:hypothetical protein
MDMPVYRYLRGYCLDPGFSTRLDTAGINEVTYRVPFETLAPGPVGEYVEVMDFDPASDCWYEPVDLSNEVIASQHGLAPSEGNPQFHQQFVYAAAMKTIRHFEVALGRKVLWNPRMTPKGRNFKPKPGLGAVHEHGFESTYVQRLRIHPHALREANAYFDPKKKALLFGYFAAAEQHQGTNFPGGLVFTCLSPDIVAHETTHAILDGIHYRYMEDTNPDVAAFHEGFADIVALLQRFTFKELVEHQLYQSGGRLDRYSVLGELATQFGEAIESNRGALRSMIGHWVGDTWEPLKPSPSDYQTNIEAHDRGAVLVATIFDAFQRIYNFRTQDLLRIASNGTGVLPEGRISMDLVGRLATEACEIATHLLHICIRALDYCPPHDITFGDYLRALISADLAIAPEDEHGYRLALIEAFRARGIFPDRVNTYSVDSLRWNSPSFTTKQQGTFNWLAGELKESIRNLVDMGVREEIHEASMKAKEKLHRLLTGKQSIYPDSEWEAFLNRLGLTSRPVSELFGKVGEDIRFVQGGKTHRSYVPKLEVHTLRPVYRAGREGRQIEQMVISLTQRVQADIGEPGAPRLMVFRGGCSLLLTLGKLSTVEYVVMKNIKSHHRFLNQAKYQRGELPGGAPSSSMYADDDRPFQLDFNLLHHSQD